MMPRIEVEISALVALLCCASCSPVEDAELVASSHAAESTLERTPGAASVPASGSAAVPAAEAKAQLAADQEGTLLHLEARSGSPDALWIEATYKVKREKGELTKGFAVDVKGAPPGTALGLSLDGFEVGKLVAGIKGKGDFELIEAGDDMFPEGFPEPKAGTVLQVGELAQLSFLPLERLTDLEARIAGPGELEGKVTYRIERLGDAVTREFQVKVTQAPEGTRHPVQLDGVSMGELETDLAGKGKLLFSTKENHPFPPGFVEPRPGSTVVVGELFRGQLGAGPPAHGQ